MRRLLALAILLALPGPAAAAAADPEAVEIPTDDGRSVPADWYAGADGLPGIVAVAEGGTSRGSWRPLADARPKGWALLVVEARGDLPPPPPPAKPGSPPPKKPGGKGAKEPPPPPLPVRQGKEVAAAARWVRDQRNADPARIGFAGAGAGALAALEGAVADGKAAAVVALSPEFGVPGFSPSERTAAWGAFPVLAAGTEEGAAAGARPLAEAFPDRPDCALRLVPVKDHAGTALLGRPEALETDLLAWLQVHLERQILDGAVDRTEERSGASLDLPTTVINLTRGSTLRVRLDGRFISFSCRVKEGDPCPPKFSMNLTVPVEEKGSRTEIVVSLSTSASEEGSLVRPFRTGKVPGDKGSSGPQPALPNAALVRGSVLETRIPWTMFGTVPAEGMTLTLRCAAEPAPSSIMFQSGLGKKR